MFYIKNSTTAGKEVVHKCKRVPIGAFSSWRGKRWMSAIIALIFLFNTCLPVYALGSREGNYGEHNALEHFGMGALAGGITAGMCLLTGGTSAIGSVASDIGGYVMYRTMYESIGETATFSPLWLFGIEGILVDILLHNLCPDLRKKLLIKLEFDIGDGKKVRISKGQFYSMLIGVAVSIGTGIVQGAIESAAESAAESAVESAAESATEAATEAALQAAAEGATEAAVEAAAEAAAEAAIEAAIESAADAAIKAALEKAAESIIKDSVEAALETVAETVAETTAELIAETIATQSTVGIVDVLVAIGKPIYKTLKFIFYDVPKFIFYDTPKFLFRLITRPVSTIKEIAKSIKGIAKSIKKEWNNFKKQIGKPKPNKYAHAVKQGKWGDVLMLSAADVSIGTGKLIASETASTVAEEKWGWDEMPASVFGMLVGQVTERVITIPVLYGLNQLFRVLPNKVLYQGKMKAARDTPATTDQGEYFVKGADGNLQGVVAGEVKENPDGGITVNGKPVMTIGELHDFINQGGSLEGIRKVELIAIASGDGQTTEGSRGPFGDAKTTKGSFTMKTKTKTTLVGVSKSKGSGIGEQTPDAVPEAITINGKEYKLSQSTSGTMNDYVRYNTTLANSKLYLSAVGGLLTKEQYDTLEGIQKAEDLGNSIIAKDAEGNDITLRQFIEGGGGLSKDGKSLQIKTADGKAGMRIRKDFSSEGFENVKNYVNKYQANINLIHSTGFLWNDVTGKPISEVGLFKGSLKSVQAMGLSPFVSAGIKILILKEGISIGGKRIMSPYRTHRGRDKDRIYENYWKMAVANAAGDFSGGIVSNIDSLNSLYAGTTKRVDDNGKVLDKPEYNNPWSTRGQLNLLQYGLKSGVNQAAQAAGRSAWGKFAKNNNIDHDALGNAGYLLASSIVSGTVDAISRRDSGKAKEYEYVRQERNKDDKWVDAKEEDGKTKYYTDSELHEQFADGIFLPDASGKNYRIYKEKQGEEYKEKERFRVETEIYKTDEKDLFTQGRLGLNLKSVVNFPLAVAEDFNNHLLQAAIDTMPLSYSYRSPGTGIDPIALQSANREAFIPFIDAMMKGADPTTALLMVLSPNLANQATQNFGNSASWAVIDNLSSALGSVGISLVPEEQRSYAAFIPYRQRLNQDIGGETEEYKKIKNAAGAHNEDLEELFKDEINGLKKKRDAKLTELNKKILESEKEYYTRDATIDYYKRFWGLDEGEVPVNFDKLLEDAQQARKDKETVRADFNKQIGVFQDHKDELANLKGAALVKLTNDANTLSQLREQRSELVRMHNSTSPDKIPPEEFKERWTNLNEQIDRLGYLEEFVKTKIDPAVDHEIAKMHAGKSVMPEEIILAMPEAINSLKAELPVLENRIHQMKMGGALNSLIPSIPLLGMLYTTSKNLGIAYAKKGEFDLPDLVRSGIVDYTVERTVTRTVAMDDNTKKKYLPERTKKFFEDGIITETQKDTELKILEAGVTEQITSTYIPSIAGVAQPIETYQNMPAGALSGYISSAKQETTENLKNKVDSFVIGLDKFSDEYKQLAKEGNFQAIRDELQQKIEAAEDDIKDYKYLTSLTGPLSEEQSKKLAKLKGQLGISQFDSEGSIEGKINSFVSSLDMSSLNPLETQKQAVDNIIYIANYRQDNPEFKHISYIPTDTYHTKEEVEATLKDINKGRILYHKDYTLASRITRDRFGRLDTTYYYAPEYDPEAPETEQWSTQRQDKTTKHYYGAFGEAYSVARDDTYLTLPKNWETETEEILLAPAIEGEEIADIKTAFNNYLSLANSPEKLTDAIRGPFKEFLDGKKGAIEDEKFVAIPFDDKEAVVAVPKEKIREDFLKLSDDEQKQMISSIDAATQSVWNKLGYGKAKSALRNGNVEQQKLYMWQLTLLAMIMYGQTDDGKGWFDIAQDNKHQDYKGLRGLTQDGVTHGLTGLRMVMGGAVYKQEGISQDVRFSPDGKYVENTEYNYPGSPRDALGFDDINDYVYVLGRVDTKKTPGTDAVTEEYKVYLPAKIADSNVEYNVALYGTGKGYSPYTGSLGSITAYDMKSGPAIQALYHSAPPANLGDAVADKLFTVLLENIKSGQPYETYEKELKKLAELTGIEEEELNSRVEKISNKEEFDKYISGQGKLLAKDNKDKVYSEWAKSVIIPQGSEEYNTLNEFNRQVAKEYMGDLDQLIGVGINKNFRLSDKKTYSLPLLSAKTGYDLLEDGSKKVRLTGALPYSYDEEVIRPVIEQEMRYAQKEDKSSLLEYLVEKQLVNITKADNLDETVLTMVTNDSNYDAFGKQTVDLYPTETLEPFSDYLPESEQDYSTDYFVSDGSQKTISMTNLSFKPAIPVSDGYRGYFKVKSTGSPVAPQAQGEVGVIIEDSKQEEFSKKPGIKQETSEETILPQKTLHKQIEQPDDKIIIEEAPVIKKETIKETIIEEPSTIDDAADFEEPKTPDTKTTPANEFWKQELNEIHKNTKATEDFIKGVREGEFGGTDTPFPGPENKALRNELDEIRGATDAAKEELKELKLEVYGEDIITPSKDDKSPKTDPSGYLNEDTVKGFRERREERERELGKTRKLLETGQQDSTIPTKIEKRPGVLELKLDLERRVVDDPNIENPKINEALEGLKEIQKSRIEMEKSLDDVRDFLEKDSLDYQSKLESKELKIRGVTPSWKEPMPVVEPKPVSALEPVIEFDSELSQKLVIDNTDYFILADALGYLEKQKVKFGDISLINEDEYDNYGLNRGKIPDDTNVVKLPSIISSSGNDAFRLIPNFIPSSKREFEPDEEVEVYFNSNTGAIYYINEVKPEQVEYADYKITLPENYREKPFSISYTTPDKKGVKKENIKCDAGTSQIPLPTRMLNLKITDSTGEVRKVIVNPDDSSLQIMPSSRLIVVNMDPTTAYSSGGEKYKDDFKDFIFSLISQTLNENVFLYKFMSFEIKGAIEDKFRKNNIDKIYTCLPKPYDEMPKGDNEKYAVVFDYINSQIQEYGYNEWLDTNRSLYSLESFNNLRPGSSGTNFVERGRKVHYYENVNEGIENFIQRGYSVSDIIYFSYYPVGPNLKKEGITYYSYRNEDNKVNDKNILFEQLIGK